VKDRGKQMQYVPVKDTGQTKHTTLRKNPKWQSSSEQMPLNPHTDTSHSHHYTLNSHALDSYKCVDLKHAFCFGSFLNIHPGGSEDMLEIHCHIDMYYFVK
jgi:hypothetical protein